MTTTSTAGSLRRANLVCRSKTGGELAVAKMVWWREIGQWVIHAYVYPHFQRRDIGAWGVRAPLLRFAADHGIEEIYFWDRSTGRTYCTTLTDIQSRGMMGESDQYGGTVNVPVAAWVVLRRKLKGIEWVPKTETVVLEPCETPWEMQSTAFQDASAQPYLPPRAAALSSSSETTSNPTPVQLTLDV